MLYSIVCLIAASLFACSIVNGIKAIRTPYGKDIDRFGKRVVIYLASSTFLLIVLNVFSCSGIFI